MTEENEFDAAGEARMWQITEQQDSFEREHEDDPGSVFNKGYRQGVKRITGMRWDRALPKFKEFLESQGQTKEAVEELLLKHRQNGFTGAKITRLRDEFAAWWEAEKSRKARESRKERGKRGRVKSKDDKRLGAKKI